MTTFPATPRSTPTRYRERASYERATAYAIIDEAYFCHLGFVVDGEPRILPTLHARIDDTLYLHGSTGSGPLLAARPPRPGCPAGLRHHPPPRRPGAGPVPVPPQRQLPLGHRARAGPPGHRR